MSGERDVDAYLLREEIAEARHMEVIAVLGIFMGVVILFVGTPLVDSAILKLLTGFLGIALLIVSLIMTIHYHEKRKGLLRKLRKLLKG